MMTTASSNRPRDPSISTADKLHCAERELRYRYRVYPRLVEAGKMTARIMHREIALMEEIAADLRKQAEDERLF
jgi:hypothetical protein